MSIDMLPGLAALFLLLAWWFAYWLDANMVQSTYWAERALNFKSGHTSNSSGALNNAYLGLYKLPSGAITSTTLDNTNTGGFGSAGALTEASSADLTGYARQALTFGTASSTVAGVGMISAGTISFNITAVVTPETIYGWFVVDSASGAGNVLFAQAETAQSINLPGTYQVGPAVYQDQSI